MRTCLVALAEHEHVHQVAVAPRPDVLTVGEILRRMEDGRTGDVPVALQRRRHVRLRASAMVSVVGDP